MGIATLPMQAPERAAEELQRAVRTLGLRGAMIGSNVMGKNLDDRSFEPLWETAAELGAFMLIHPNNVAGIDRLRSYYLNNLIGNPLDTTIAAACLVFGGVHGAVSEAERAARCTAAALCRTRPGAGRTAGTCGRSRRSTSKRRRSRGSTASITTRSCTPSRSSNFWSARLGASRVLLGSDYPYDMGTGECVRQVKALWIDDGEKAAILQGNAVRLFGA